MPIQLPFHILYFVRMPTLHATSRSPPPESHVIHSPHSNSKVLSTFQQYPPTTSSRPLSTPIKLKQFHHDVLRHHQDRLAKIGTTVQQQSSLDETANILNPRLPSEAVQSATLPHTFLSSKRGRKSRSSNRHPCSEESSVGNRGITASTAAGDDADSESDSIDSIYKRLSGPQTSPPPISECVRILKNMLS